jgi:hypothetical protein
VLGWRFGPRFTRRRLDPCQSVRHRLGPSSNTACEVMSGAGADPVVRSFIALSYRGAGGTGALAGDNHRRTALLQRCIRNEQQCEQHRTDHCKKRQERALARFRPGSFQKEMPFRINRPAKMAVSDRPNTCVVLYSLVLNTCAVARSFVFVMTSIPAFRLLSSARKS